MADETTFVYVKENIFKSDHGIRGSQKVYIQAYIIHCHIPTCYVVREVKKVPMLQKSGCRCEEMPLYIYMKEEGREVERVQVKYEKNPKKPYDIGQIYGL